MEIEHFDTDLFIDEVQKRPALWDMGGPDYKNKILKKRNWEELVEIFNTDGDDLEKKRMLGASLMKKWKSLRDNYMRESKKQKNLPSGSGTSRHTPYVYFRKLNFLQNSTATKETESNFQSNEVVNVNDGENLDIMPTPARDSTLGSGKKRKINEVDKQIIEILEKSLKTTNNSGTSDIMKDDDKLFCLSLYSELKKVPENRRLSTKIELLSVIQRAQMSHRTTPQLPQVPQPTHVFPYSPNNPVYVSTNMRTPASTQQSGWEPSPSQEPESLDLF